jgi:homogentisate phytyltransferase / homogentisate geranylgeranyltransferase
MSQVPLTHPLKFWQDPLSWSYSLWKFSRPHTIIGTSLSVFALYVIALATTDSQLTPSSLGQVLGAWLSCLLGNIYIVGLNQLEDVAIDRINKPHLPLASGEFSRGTGLKIVFTTGILALSIATWLGWWLLATVAISLSIGTAYSLPPFRLKRFPFWAAFCILTVRGVIVNLGLFLHFSKVLTNQGLLPLPVGLITLFVLVFTIAIAIFKDIPDLEGDRQYQITTFTLILGKKRIFDLALWIHLLLSRHDFLRSFTSSGNKSDYFNHLSCPALSLTVVAKSGDKFRRQKRSQPILSVYLEIVLFGIFSISHRLYF